MVCGQRIYFILFDHRFRSALPMQVLSDCFFYQTPVEMETVQDGTLLGFTIDVVQRTVRYQVHRSKYLHYGKFAISVLLAACVSVCPD
jgi:hypothetical protein